MTTPPILSSLIGFHAEGCGLQEASLNQTRSAWAKIDKTMEWTDYLSNKRQKIDDILMIYACGFGLRPLLEVILYRLLSFKGAHWLSIVRSREVSATRRF